MKKISVLWVTIIIMSLITATFAFADEPVPLDSKYTGKRFVITRAGNNATVNPISVVNPDYRAPVRSMITEEDLLKVRKEMRKEYRAELYGSKKKPGVITAVKGQVAEIKKMLIGGEDDEDDMGLVGDVRSIEKDLYGDGKKSKGIKKRVADHANAINAHSDSIKGLIDNSNAIDKKAIGADYLAQWALAIAILALLGAVLVWWKK